MCTTWHCCGWKSLIISPMHFFHEVYLQHNPSTSQSTRSLYCTVTWWILSLVSALLFPWAPSMVPPQPSWFWLSLRLLWSCGLEMFFSFPSHAFITIAHHLQIARLRPVKQWSCIQLADCSDGFTKAIKQLKTQVSYVSTQDIEYGSAQWTAAWKLFLHINEFKI